MEPPSNVTPEIITLEQMEEAGRTLAASLSSSRPTSMRADVHLATTQGKPPKIPPMARGVHETEDEAATLLGEYHSKEQLGLSVFGFFKLVSVWGGGCREGARDFTVA